MGNCTSTVTAEQPRSTCPAPVIVLDGGSENDLDFEACYPIQHAQVIPKFQGALRESYRLDIGELGSGSYGTVCRAVHSTGEQLAVKTIRHRGEKDRKVLQNEFATMQAMDHPNAIKLFEAYEDEKCTYMVMELCEGGELLDRLLQARTFAEGQAAIVTQQILRAVRYVHSKDIAHRDVKPQNFLLTSKDTLENNTLKLIDFGMACKCKPGTVLRTCAGTALYVAPEVLKGHYNQQCDLWSVGVTLYALLSGGPPFTGNSEQAILRKVKKGNYSLEGSRWRRISQDCKDLVCQLMNKSPAERLTAEQALQHAWIARKTPAPRNTSLNRELVERLQGFRVQNKLERAVLQIVARRLSEDKVKDLREAFEALDSNGDGKLTPKELRSGLCRHGIEHDRLDLSLMMAMADADGSGEIDYSEFLAATLDQRLHLTDEALLAAFQVFDRDGDGCISEQELKQVLWTGMDDSCEWVLQLLNDLDANKNGIIEFDEFKSGVMPGRAARAGAESAPPLRKKSATALPRAGAASSASHGGA